MITRTTCVAVLCLSLSTMSFGDEKTAAGGHQPHAGMLRYPDVSATHVAFVYANDVWIVPREGGMAAPLAGPPGAESFPRFSPDGRSLAFVGNYEGNRDIYVMPVEGGVATRVTHHPAGETLCDWTPDGRLLYFSNGMAGLPRMNQLFSVAAAGGLPERLPVPYGANAAVSADGTWLAYTPHTIDARTWKRYRGGMATDIWLFNLRDKTSKKITDWEGTDSQPMWHGGTVYYMSDDGPEHRLNIWTYDTQSGERRQITHFQEFDVKWPAIGPGPDGKGEIVLQNGAQLLMLSLPGGQSRPLQVTIPGDRATIRPKDYDASKFIQAAHVSPTGQRAVFQARGDLWTAPAKHGSPRNLTRTDGVAERDPAWSPDGQWLTYLCDATGEYELYVTQSDGRGESRRLTTDGAVFRYGPTWSPDSKRIAFTDKTNAIFLHTVEGGGTVLVDKLPWGGTGRMSWSSDSGWLAYTRTGDNQMSAMWLYQVEGGTKHQVTSGMFSDSWPTFDRKGDYLYFASAREFSAPIYEDVGNSFVYANLDLMYAVPLRAEVGSPWAPKSDEEKWGEEKKKEEEKAKQKEKEKKGEKSEDDKDKSADSQPTTTQATSQPDAVKPVVIELEGFEARALQAPLSRGAFYNLSVNHEHKLVYTRGPARGSDAKPSIKIFDPEDEEKDLKKREKTVLDEVGDFLMSADGKKLLIHKEETWAVVDAAPDQKLENPMTLAGMTGRADAREEWRQIFAEAWRVQRDFFYDPNMHGVDWPAMRNRYEVMLQDCVSREDVDFVIGEMISELNVGHAYVTGGGDLEKPPSVSVGMLAADFELHEGAYRIARIYAGAPWDADARAPLARPGLDVKVGDYLLAVNGATVDVAKDPWAAFQGLAGKVITLTVSERPKLDEKARHVLVEANDGEQRQRYRAWIEKNRTYVAEKSGGRIGYIYVPNTGTDGQNDLFRQFYGQMDKEALVIDERWNGGGQIPTRFIELLNRPATNYWATRDTKDWRWPPDAQQGPKCMLINGLAGSGGDCFPYYFRQRGLGKLIGMRTWGGLVGISGNPQLIDNGGTTAPTFAFYELDGTWGVEGHGVDPDIEVVDDPALMTSGGDPQLDRAIAHLTEELQRNPFKAPQRPKYPDRKGMGIRPEDK